MSWNCWIAEWWVGIGVVESNYFFLAPVGGLGWRAGVDVVELFEEGLGVNVVGRQHLFLAPVGGLGVWNCWKA